MYGQIHAIQKGDNIAKKLKYETKDKELWIDIKCSDKWCLEKYDIFHMPYVFSRITGTTIDENIRS